MACSLLSVTLVCVSPSLMGGQKIEGVKSEKNGNCLGVNGKIRKSKGKVKGRKVRQQIHDQPVIMRG